jgi:hypothetical protein
MSWLSRFLDHLSEFLASRKGLIPIFGLILILINFLFQVLMGDSFLARTNLFLHLGVFLGFLGLMLARIL